MYKKSTKIINPTGLHARPASDFIACAGKFKSKVYIKRMKDNASAVDAKSIIMLLSLGLPQGEMVEISADGEDEKAAVEALIALMNSGFGEMSSKK